MDINNIEIVVGTYEEFLLGYKLVNAHEKEFELIQSFATHSHTSSIRTVSHGGRFLASGSADETIALYDMKERKEIGALSHHKSTITSLKFTYDGTHLLSGCKDGTLAICRAGNWQLEKIFNQAHKDGSIVDIAIHPSDKLVLSIGTDGIMKIWNLIKGRHAYATNLGGRRKGIQLIGVIWSDDGELYAIASVQEVTIYQLSNAGILKSVQIESKIASICFYEHFLLVGSENGKIYIISLKNDEIKNIEVHKDRVRCLKVFLSNKGSQLITCGSNGDIKLWSIKTSKSQYIKLNEYCSVSTGCRITSLDILECMTHLPKEESMETIEDENPEVVNKEVSNENEIQEKSNKKVKKKRK